MTRSEILQAADTIINGQRQQDYGSPEDAFRNIAALWQAYLNDRGCQHRDFEDVVFINEIDVAHMMILMKIARGIGGVGTDDTFVDMAGYAAIAGEISGKKREDYEGLKKKMLKTIADMDDARQGKED